MGAGTPQVAALTGRAFQLKAGRSTRTRSYLFALRPVPAPAGAAWLRRCRVRPARSEAAPATRASAHSRDGEAGAHVVRCLRGLLPTLALMASHAPARATSTRPTGTVRLQLTNPRRPGRGGRPCAGTPWPAGCEVAPAWLTARAVPHMAKC